MNKKNIFIWALYDLANSITTVTFFLYFSQWLVVDNHIPDIWFNLIFVGSTVLLLSTAPIFGSIADRIGVWLPSLRTVTFLEFIVLFLLSLITVLVPMSATTLVLVIVLFLLGNFFYLFSLTFYTAFLPKIAPSKKIGWISGIGQAANWTGNLVGLGLVLPFATGKLHIIGAAGRAQTFLPATIAFAILSLPMLIFFKEPNQARKVIVKLSTEYANYFKAMIGLTKVPGLGRYILGYFFISDAIITVQTNFAIFLNQVFNIPDKTKTLILAGALITSVLGALLSGWLSDRVGLKKSLLIILSSWVIFLPLLAVVQSLPIFIILGISLGLFYGATWTVTRAVVSYLTPKDRLNSVFSFYVCFERFSTFVGPVAWGLITLLLVNTGGFRYRVALISMTVFIAIGLFIVRKIPAKSVN